MSLTIDTTLIPDCDRSRQIPTTSAEAISSNIRAKVIASLENVKEEFGVMATFAHPLDFGKNWRDHGRVLSNKVVGKENSIVYSDSRNARRSYVINTPVGLVCLAEMPHLILSVGAWISNETKNVIASNWFQNAKKFVSVLMSNSITRFVVKYLPYLMLANAYWQIKRKYRSIQETNNFLQQYKQLSREDFVTNLQEKYFKLSKDEILNIDNQANAYVEEISNIYENIISDEILLEVREEGEQIDSNQSMNLSESAVAKLKNEKIEELSAKHLGLKVHELSFILGKSSVEELTKEVMVSLVHGLSSDDSEFKIDRVIAGIINQAKCKRTADRIDQMVQICFAAVAVCMLIGSAAAGLGLVLTIAGWAIWIISLVYNEKALSKNDWNKILNPPTRVENDGRMSFIEFLKLIAATSGLTYISSIFLRIVMQRL